MEAWRQWLPRREKPCFRKRLKNLLDSDRPSHGRPLHSNPRFHRHSVLCWPSPPQRAAFAGEADRTIAFIFALKSPKVISQSNRVGVTSCGNKKVFSALFASNRLIQSSAGLTSLGDQCTRNVMKSRCCTCRQRRPYNEWDSSETWGLG